MDTSPPKYRGFSGALAYGVFIVVLVAVSTAIVASLNWAMTGHFDIDSPIIKRLLMFGGLAGLSAFLCRWLAKAECNHLLSMKLARGDLGSFGLFAGLLAAGAVTTTPWESVLSTGNYAKVRVGQEIQIAGPTVDGGRFDIAENLGQVTVVDFWATWCGPCVASLPDLVKLYEQHKDRGLRVVGVSLDNSQEQLEGFLAKHPLPWKQIFFGAGGNPLAEKYGIDLIPHVIVVDRQGKVAADDVHGPSLRLAVTKALGGTAAGEPEEQPLHRRLLDWLMRGVFTSNPLWLSAYMIGGALVAVALEVLIRSLTR